MLSTRQRDTHRFIRDDIGRTPLPKGERRIAAGSLDGDMVELEQYTPANDNDIVAALIDGEEAPLERHPRGAIAHRVHSGVGRVPGKRAVAVARQSLQGRLVDQMRRYR